MVFLLRAFTTGSSFFHLIKVHLRYHITTLQTSDAAVLNNSFAECKDGPAMFFVDVIPKCFYLLEIQV